jgi:hypothetical protein
MSIQYLPTAEDEWLEETRSLRGRLPLRID